MSESENDLSPEIRFHLIRRMERLKVIGLGGTELLPHEAKYLEFHRVAGVILFERNVRSLAQVTDLIGAVGEALAEGPTPLVMADHEGDFVSELKNIIGIPPAPLALAAAGETSLAREVARETGEAMVKLGVNTVLAPVADVYLDASSPITGLRTFGCDPEVVAELVGQTIHGYRDAGVLSCAKHFPGHGSTPEDSHETLPEVKKTLGELAAADLIPFQRAIEEDVDMIMMSHVAYPMGSEELVPASFDARVIKGLLRKELGYDGVVITDALEMAGARWYTDSRYGGFSGGSEHALLAGSDLLLHSRPVPEQVIMQGETDPVMSVDVIETIIKTLESVVDRSRVDDKLAEAAQDNEALANVLDMLEQSGERVERLRARLAPVGERGRSGGSKVIAFDAYPSIPHVYRDAAERSVVALTDWSEFAPLDPAASMVVMPVEWHTTGSLHRQDLDQYIEVLGKHFPRWRRTQTVHQFAPTPDGGARPVVSAEGGVVDAARFSGTVEPGTVEIGPDEELLVLLSARGTPSELFLASLQTFAEEVSPAVVVVTGWPVLDWIPESTPALWSIGASPQVASAVARILSGDLDPTGKLDGLIPS